MKAFSNNNNRKIYQTKFNKINSMLKFQQWSFRIEFKQAEKIIIF